MAGSGASKRVLVTAGPNHEYIDAIHYLGNVSSGALGRFVAEECLERGLPVTFVHGPGSVVPAPRPALRPALRPDLRVVAVRGVSDLLATLGAELPGGAYGAIFHAMAVLDYVPEGYQDKKTASGLDEWVVRFVKAPKVIDHIKQWAPGIFLAACKLEYQVTAEELVASAQGLARRTGADLIVANDYHVMLGGEHHAFIVRAGAPPEPLKGKRDIARAVASAIAAALGGR